MLNVVLFFLMFSLFLYVLLGGADFGAGIVELFSSKKNQEINRKTVYRVMGPIWEVNHIWLIIILVILWVAFPGFFNVIVIYLHIPLTLVLLGITLRGVAFVFRHYDAIIDSSQKIYNRMFRVSSLITPIFLGMSFGTLVAGRISLTEDYESRTFSEIFVAPWLNSFSILVGFFYAALCAFLAATLLIGETSGNVRKIYSRKAANFTIAVVVIGLALMAYGYLSEVRFVKDFLQEPISMGAVIFSGVLLFPLWRSVNQGWVVQSRVLIGIQVILILFSAIYAHFPDLILTQEGDVSLFAEMAPESTIFNLALMLLIGGFIILPGVFHLLQSFKMIKILGADEQEYEQYSSKRNQNSKNQE